MAKTATPKTDKPLNIFHISAECFPAAKVGGLADVVGALPKYLTREGHSVSVVIPGYDNAFSRETRFDAVFEGTLEMGSLTFKYSIVKAAGGPMGFELFQIRIPGLFDRPDIYAYPDDTERFTAFQIAFLDWAVAADFSPDIVHCHDHHTGLVPFMMQHCTKYRKFSRVPSILTIHNAQYQGWFGLEKMNYLPEFDHANAGYLEWNNCINPLGTAIKCAWRVTTVSPTYLEEMASDANGLESLLRHERAKSIGILNGIDTEVWNPETDSMLDTNYTIETRNTGKAANKRTLCDRFGLDPELPVLAFIGRLVYEKGADLLPGIARKILSDFKGRANVLILGSGDPDVEAKLTAVRHFYRTHYNCHIGYDERLAHLVYGGGDFLLMPSRVEPCGLNQMYALRYGTVPVVRRTGGLKDTVTDMADGGFGICHDEATIDNMTKAVERAIALFRDKEKFNSVTETGMRIDHSWNAVARQYIELYKKLKTYT